MQTWIVSLAIFLAIQLGGAVWWASATSSELEALQRVSAGRETILSTVIALQALLPQQLSDLKGRIVSIEQKIDRLDERLDKLD